MSRTQANRTVATNRIITRNFPHGLKFDGVNDIVRIPDSPSLSPTSAMTAMVWVKGAAQSNKGIFSQYDTGASNRRFVIGSSHADGYNKLQIYLSGNGMSYKDYASSIVIFDNTWHLIGFTFGGGVLKLYADGVYDDNPIINTEVTITTLYNSTVDIMIGCRLADNIPTIFFNGDISGARIYDKALTAQEMSDIYRKDVIPAGAVAEYFKSSDDGSGDALKDTAGTNHGVITSATWITDTPFKERTVASGRTVA